MDYGDANSAKDEIHLSITSRKVSLSGVFWTVFFRIQTEYGEILRVSQYSVRMRENTDQKNSKYGHFSRSAYLPYFPKDELKS